jgi:hypothetical protein
VRLVRVNSGIDVVEAFVFKYLMVELVGIEPTTSSLRIMGAELEGDGGSGKEKAGQATKKRKRAK